MTEIVLIIINVTLFIIIISFFFTLRKSWNASTALQSNFEQINKLLSNFAISMQKINADITERMTRTNADLRQELADRLNNYFNEIRTNLNTVLIESRNINDQKISDSFRMILNQFNEFKSIIDNDFKTNQAIIQKELSTGRQESIKSLSATFENFFSQLNQMENKTATSLENIRTKVDEKLSAIGQQVQSKLDENIREGFKHFEKVQEHLKLAESQLQDLNVVGNSINELNNLLRLPHLRGGFGEASLERLLNDFLPAGIYELQSLISSDSKERVDAIINLPNGKLPIDSKFPRDKLIALFEHSNEEELKKAREELIKIVKLRAQDIANKYIKPEHGTTDMALMFLPSETIYFEIIRNTDLWESMVKFKVFPVSPNTFSITIKSISIAHQYYQMAQNVQVTIKELQKAQAHFEHFQKNFEMVGKKIAGAQEAFQKATTNLTRYNSSVSRLAGETAPESASEFPSELPPTSEESF